MKKDVQVGEDHLVGLPDEDPVGRSEMLRGQAEVDLLLQSVASVGSILTPRGTETSGGSGVATTRSTPGLAQMAPSTSGETGRSWRPNRPEAAS